MSQNNNNIHIIGIGVRPVIIVPTVELCQYIECAYIESDYIE